MRNLFALAGFVMLALICWGLVVPLLEVGQVSMRYGAWRALICFGSAFSLLAVVGPIFWLRSRDEQGHWSTRGVLWGVLAGTAAALGALGVVLALKYRGHPLIVVPAVVGLIPIVYSLISMWTSGTLGEISRLFYGAVVLVGLGVVGVFVFQPRAGSVEIDELDDGHITVTRQLNNDQALTWTAENLADLRTNPNHEAGYRWYQLKKRLTFAEFTWVTLSVLLAALCWGSYSSISRQCRRAMDGSRLRPLIVVGVVLLALTVVLPIVLMNTSPAGGRWTLTGIVCCVLAGIAAGGGALGLIGALNSGGKSWQALPVIVGGTLLIGTVVALFQQGDLSDASWWYIGSLLLVIIGAVGAPMLRTRRDGEDADAADDEEPATKDKHAGRQSTAPASPD